MKFIVLYGSVRSERQGIKAAQFIHRKIIEMDHESVLIDPMEYKLPFLDKMYKEFNEGEAPENMEKLSGLLESADGFVIVSAEYNHSIPPALKNLMDHFQREYFFKPSAIVSYSAGNYGGVNAAAHLRIICGELGTPAISSILSVPYIADAFDDDGNPRNDAYHRRAKRFLNELFWYAGALKKGRKEGEPF